MKRKYFFLTILFILAIMPLVKAEDCGLLNLASCLSQKIFDFILNILNAPIQPLLAVIKSLLTDPISLTSFTSLWAIVLYILSLFYGILFFWSGFNFIISGYDVIKRMKAKEWLRNIVIMIVLIQASYFIYSLALDINSYLTAGIINLTNSQFFLLTADNIVNVGLQFFFAFMYVITLLFTLLLLTIRYIIVATGVALFPIGIFLYFIPALRHYGKLIINFLGICIFVTFFDAIIFLTSSMLVQIPAFSNVKILIMITAFTIANFLMFYFMIFSALKSAFKSGGKVAQTAVVVAQTVA